MTRLPKVAVQHLDDATHEWLLTATRTVLLGYPDTCDWCHHGWHSVRCCVCACDTARTRRDDTWRPVLSYGAADQLRIICADTGVDGYVGRYATLAANPTRMPTPQRMKTLLYGRGQD